MSIERVRREQPATPLFASGDKPRVLAHTKLLGLLGEDISHADLAFSFNNRLLSYWGPEFVYVPYSVCGDCLDDAVRGIRGLNVLGCNVTFPHKVPIVQHLDRLETKTQLMDSVNLVVNREGELWGYNTDSQGFMDALAATGLMEQLDSALIYGAGGAGRALAAALAIAGVQQIWIYDVVEARGREVQNRLNHNGSRVVAVSEEEICRLRPALIVNATPLGRAEQADLSPVHDLCIGEAAKLFFDLNYNPARSRFLLQGEALGVPIENGLRMMCYQAKRSIEIAVNRQIPCHWFYAAIEDEGLEESLVYAGEQTWAGR